MNRPYGEERVRRAKGRRGGDGPAAGRDARDARGVRRCPVPDGHP